MQVRHAGQPGTGHKTIASVSRCYHRVKNERRYRSTCYGISFRRVAALVEAPKEFAADSELQSEVILCPRREVFVDFDLQKDNHTCWEANNGAGTRAHGGRKRGRENGTHMLGQSTPWSARTSLYMISPFPLTFFFGHGLQYDLACDVSWRHLSGGMAHGAEGQRSGGVRVGG